LLFSISKHSYRSIAKSFGALESTLLEGPLKKSRMSVVVQLSCDLGRLGGAVEEFKTRAHWPHPLLLLHTKAANFASESDNNCTMDTSKVDNNLATFYISRSPDWRAIDTTTLLVSERPAPEI